MTATKVGILRVPRRPGGLCRRRHLAVTRHGQTVGYFIPVKQDRAADAAAAHRAAGGKLDALLRVTEGEVDEMVDEFKLRKARPGELHRAPRGRLLLLVRAVLGKRVKDIITTYAVDAEFFVPSVAYDDAERPGFRRRSSAARPRSRSARLLTQLRETVTVPEEGLPRPQGRGPRPGSNNATPTTGHDPRHSTRLQVLIERGQRLLRHWRPHLDDRSRRSSTSSPRTNRFCSASPGPSSVRPRAHASSAHLPSNGRMLSCAILRAWPETSGGRG